MGRIRLVALLVLLWGSQPGDGQPVLSGPAGGVFYSGKNVLYPLPIDFSINAGVLVKPWTIEVELKNARYTSSSAMAADSVFVLPAEFITYDDTTPTLECLSDAVAIKYFMDFYLLPCNKVCRNRELLKLEVLKEFAGVPEYELVLTDEALPSSFCSLGRHFATEGPIGNGTEANLARMLQNLHFLSPDLGCADLVYIAEFPDLGCETVEIGVSVLDATGFKEQGAISISGIIALTPPNLRPILQGNPGFSELEVGAEVDVAPLFLYDPDADYLTLSIETTGLVRLTLILEPPPLDPSIYQAPQFQPLFSFGGVNVATHKIVVNATQGQVNQALAHLRFQGVSVGLVNLTITVDDQGRTGYPVGTPTLSDFRRFSIDIRPSNVPPTLRFVNSDETFRFDWRPGVKYLLGGVEKQIPDDLFPCGGDTVRGTFDFSRDGSGAGTDAGWKGALPPGDGSSALLKRDCATLPGTFWNASGRAMYVTLDEGGKGRTFVQMQSGTSGCDTSGNWKVTMAIQNANYSRTNIPAATVAGYKMDWFECQAGKWYCELRNPRFSLDNTNGAVGRLKFWYDQEHRHLGDGSKDYRMTFSGAYADVQAAMANVTVEFPWIDEAYAGADQIVPWPFKSWPRTGRSFLGSNILRVRLEDVPSQYDYIMKNNRMWTVQGVYKVVRLGSLGEAKLVCDADLTCYGFQYLEYSQLEGIVEQLMVPTVGLGDGSSDGKPDLVPGDTEFIAGSGFSDIPPANWGLGGSTWDEMVAGDKTIDWSTVIKDDIPNTFFYREKFEQYDAQPYPYNAMTYTKRIKTSVCLGPHPHVERLLDIRVLSRPINQAPVLTAEKPVWGIQNSYEFPIAGLRLWDVDALWLDGKMAVTLEATRGAFTNPDASGLTFTTGTGVKDQLIQTFLCRYPDCQRAISEVRYQSADEAGTDVITVTVDDRGNSGELGSQVASVAISLTLSSGPYNIPPTVDIPGLPARVTHLGQRVDISGITVQDLDINKPRWDKFYSQGKMTVHFSIGTGMFDVKRLVKYGMTGSLILGTHDGSVDLDCPCLVNGTLCPCNTPRLTTYVKFSGLLEDVQWAVQEISVYLFQEVDTRLFVTVSDNCNTGFSDDSGQQLPCLTDSDSVVIRVVVKSEAAPFLYVSSSIGRDETRGRAAGGEQGYVVLMQNASVEDDAYVGRTLRVVDGTGMGESAVITGYNGKNRTVRIPLLPSKTDNTSVYQISCGSEKAPCRSLHAVVNQTLEHGIVLVTPGVYTGPLNRELDFEGKTMTLKSTHGYNDTVFDCEGAGTLATFSPTDRFRVILEGFSIRNCVAKQGGALSFRRVRQIRVSRVDASGADTSACEGLACVATPVIRHCYFYNNRASSFGGALFIKEGRPKFQDCIFFSNTANVGGAVYIRGGLATFERCSFYGNAAQLNGGGVMVNGGRTTMTKCRFSLNAATTSGGAIAALAGRIELVESELRTNFAGVVDGGVHVLKGDVSLQACIQDGNTAGRHANTLVDNIQNQRQQSHYSISGFGSGTVYRDINAYKTEL